MAVASSTGERSGSSAQVQRPQAGAAVCHRLRRTLDVVNLRERWTNRKRRDPIGAEVDEIFSPARKHIHERKEWVAVAKSDDRESGDDPLVDLNSGVATLTPRVGRSAQ